MIYPCDMYTYICFFFSDLKLEIKNTAMKVERCVQSKTPHLKPDAGLLGWLWLVQGWWHMSKTTQIYPHGQAGPAWE